MTTPTKGVPVTLDKKRHLRFSLGSLRRIQDMGEGEDVSALAVDKLAEVLVLGLSHEDPDLTAEQVEEIVDTENLPEVVEALRKIFGRLNGENGGPAPKAVKEGKKTRS